MQKEKAGDEKDYFEHYCLISLKRFFTKHFLVIEVCRYKKQSDNRYKRTFFAINSVCNSVTYYIM